MPSSLTLTSASSAAGREGSPPAQNAFSNTMKSAPGPSTIAFGSKLRTISAFVAERDDVEAAGERAAAHGRALHDRGHRREPEARAVAVRGAHDLRDEAVGTQHAAVGAREASVDDELAGVGIGSVEEARVAEGDRRARHPPTRGEGSDEQARAAVAQHSATAHTMDGDLTLRAPARVARAGVTGEETARGIFWLPDQPLDEPSPGRCAEWRWFVSSPRLQRRHRVGFTPTSRLVRPASCSRYGRARQAS